MPKFKLLLCTVTAIAALAVASSVAVAFRAAISPAGAISMTSSGMVTFGSSPAVSCALTFNGTLVSNVSLAANERLGGIQQARIGSCSGGSIDLFLNLTWGIGIDRILGTLPDNATGVLLNIVSFAMHFPVMGGIVNCLYRGAAGVLLALADTGTNTYTTGTVGSLSSVPLIFVTGSVFCPEFVEMTATFTLTRQTLTVS